jgi:hypothetical protein
MQTLAKKALAQQLAGSWPPVDVEDPDAGLLRFEDGFNLAIAWRSHGSGQGQCIICLTPCIMYLL